MKQLLSGILASTLLLPTSSVGSAEEISEDGAGEPTQVAIQTQTLSTSAEEDFSMNETGVITSYKGSGGDVVIPASVGGRTVTAIAANVFKNDTSLESGGDSKHGEAD